MQLPLLWTPAPPVAPSVWREMGLWLLGEGPRPDEPRARAARGVARGAASG